MDSKYVYDTKKDKDIDKLISFLTFVNSDYIDIKGIKKDLKKAKKEYDEK